MTPTHSARAEPAVELPSLASRDFAYDTALQLPTTTAAAAADAVSAPLMTSELSEQSDTEPQRERTRRESQTPLFAPPRTSSEIDYDESLPHAHDGGSSSGEDVDGDGDVSGAEEEEGEGDDSGLEEYTDEYDEQEDEPIVLSSDEVEPAANEVAHDDEPQEDEPQEDEMSVEQEPPAVARGEQDTEMVPDDDDDGDDGDEQERERAVDALFDELVADGEPVQSEEEEDLDVAASLLHSNAASDLDADAAGDAVAPQSRKASVPLATQPAPTQPQVEDEQQVDEQTLEAEHYDDEDADEHGDELPSFYRSRESRPQDDDDDEGDDGEGDYDEDQDELAAMYYDDGAEGNEPLDELDDGTSGDEYDEDEYAYDYEEEQEQGATRPPSSSRAEPDVIEISSSEDEEEAPPWSESPAPQGVAPTVPESGKEAEDELEQEETGDIAAPTDLSDWLARAVDDAAAQATSLEPPIEQETTLAPEDVAPPTMGTAEPLGAEALATAALLASREAPAVFEMTTHEALPTLSAPTDLASPEMSTAQLPGEDLVRSLVAQAAAAAVGSSDAAPETTLGDVAPVQEAASAEEQPADDERDYDDPSFVSFLSAEARDVPAMPMSLAEPGRDEDVRPVPRETDGQEPLAWASRSPSVATAASSQDSLERRAGLHVDGALPQPLGAGGVDSAAEADIEEFDTDEEDEAQAQVAVPTPAAVAAPVTEGVDNEDESYDDWQRRVGKDMRRQVRRDEDDERLMAMSSADEMNDTPPSIPGTLLALLLPDAL